MTATELLLTGEFENLLLMDSVEIDPDISKIIDEHFWELF